MFTENDPNVHQTRELISQPWYTHIMKFYSALKRNTTVIYTTM